MKPLLRLFPLMLVAMLLLGCGSSESRRDSFYEKAKQALAAGETKDAEIALKNALKLDPQFAKGYTLMGNVQMQDRNFANAFGNYSRAAELDPGEIDAQVGLCKLYFMQRSFDKVEEKADIVLAKDQQHVEAGILKAIALIRKGQTDDALARLAALQVKNPENVDIVLAQSEAYNERKDMESAERVILEGVAKNPRNLLLHLHLANLYVQNKRLDDAEKHFKEIASIEAQNPGANMLLVNFYSNTGQKQKAAAAIETLTQRFPKEEAFRLAQADITAQSAGASETEAVLSRALADFPASNQIRLALAEHYARTMQPLKAESILKQIIDKDPDLPQAVRARRILASAYLAGQQPDKARAELDQVLKRNPRDTEGHFLMGALELQKGQIREAILELRQVVDADPKSVKALQMLANSHIMNNEVLQAEALLKKSVSDNPDNLQTRMLLVETMVAAGKVDNALRELNAMAEKDRSNPAVHVLMGDVYAQRQKLNEAKAAYRKAIEVAPKEAVAHVRLGRLLWAQQDTRGALASFEQALSISQDAKDAAEAKAALLIQDKRQAEALQFTRQLVAAQPKDAFNHALLGRVLLAANDLTGAEAEFTLAIQLAPEAAAPYHLLGQVYLSQGKIDAGISRYRDAYTANPSNPQVGLALAMLLHVNKKFDEAKTVYEQILAGNGNFVPAANNLAFLYVENLPTPENFKKAQALIGKLKDVDNPLILDTVGWVQFKLGDKDAALTTTMRAWSKVKNAPAIAYHLAVIHQAKGETQKAVGWYEKALAGNADFPEKAAAQAELAALRGKR